MTQPAPGSAFAHVLLNSDPPACLPTALQVWELIICDPERSFEYAQYYPNNKINSTEVGWHPTWRYGPSALPAADQAVLALLAHPDAPAVRGPPPLL